VEHADFGESLGAVVMSGGGGVKTRERVHREIAPELGLEHVDVPDVLPSGVVPPVAG